MEYSLQSSMRSTTHPPDGTTKSERGRICRAFLNLGVYARNARQRDCAALPSRARRALCKSSGFLATFLTSEVALARAMLQAKSATLEISARWSP